MSNWISISVDELAERLPDILERVRDRGEHIVVERDGVPLATLAPPAPPEVGPAQSFRELAARLADLSWPDDEFANDVEAAQADMNRQPLTVPEWPS